MNELPKINENLYKAWYFQLPVQYKLCEYTKNREFACLSKIIPQKSIRTLRVHTPQHFQFWTQKVLRNKVQPEPFYNYYFSLATYKGGLPLQSASLRHRNNDDFKQNHHKRMVSYDMLIDIDAYDLNQVMEAYDQTKNIVGMMKTPFYLSFSGLGFHIRIPHEYLPAFSLDPSSNLNIYEYVASMQKKLHKKYDLVDCRINDSRRLCKIPYTLSVYADKTYSVCFPFVTIEEFERFNLDMISVDYWMRQDIRSRKAGLIEVKN